MHRITEQNRSSCSDPCIHQSTFQRCVPPLKRANLAPKSAPATKMKTLRIFATVLTLFGAWAGQEGKWQVTPTKDAFTRAAFTRYTLEGKYLQTPKNAAPDSAPKIVLDCKPEHKWKTEGKIASAFLILGNVVADSHIVEGSALLHDKFQAKVKVEYRLDDGKVHEEFLYASTDLTSVSLQPKFCGPCTVADLFYGHQLPHREGSGPQVQKVQLRVPEFQGVGIVMQFDLGDVTEVARACGILWRK